MTSNGAADVPIFTLNNGHKIPGVGKGYWLGPEGGHDVAEEMCRNALKVGYRHIDTAAGYNNEQLVGKAIKESGIPRSEIFLTTKLRPRDQARVHEAFEDSRKNLDTEYIDLYLMHWPQTATPEGDVLADDASATNFVNVWKQMEKLLDTGKVRSIGVSNFSIKNLEILLKHATVVPANNQVEVNPCLPQFALQKYCEEKGILLTAYSPFGQGNGVFFADPDFVKVAEAHQATTGQVAVSWLVQRGIPPLPKSQNLERMTKNITLIKLTPEEVEIINNIHKKPDMHRSLLKYHTPEGRVFGWTYEQLGWEGMTTGGYIRN